MIQSKIVRIILLASTRLRFGPPIELIEPFKSIGNKYYLKTLRFPTDSETAGNWKSILHLHEYSKQKRTFRSYDHRLSRMIARSNSLMTGYCVAMGMVSNGGM